MKLSTHHATHGLEGTVRLLHTGETLHLVFPKGKFRAQVQINIGGHRMETEFELVPFDAPRDADVDMRIQLVAPVEARKAPRAVSLPPAVEPPKQITAAQDGAAMEGNKLPERASRAPRHYLKDGLPPNTSAEPEPRAMTAREARTEARDIATEKEKAGLGEKPEGKKRAAAKPRSTPVRA